MVMDSSPPLVQELFQVGGGVHVARGAGCPSQGTWHHYVLQNCQCIGERKSRLTSGQFCHCFNFSADNAALPPVSMEDCSHCHCPLRTDPLTGLCVVVHELLAPMATPG